jgi:hypothetical protein
VADVGSGTMSARVPSKSETRRSSGGGIVETGEFRQTVEISLDWTLTHPIYARGR